ncbi:hypothetical protein CANINC_001351 [Pichia inconspicua]|uniref:RING-type domain-containing protein n=1 Tax=Pichia inconspicua TaxID=52247 RepID=A0A4T0X468_9ASCO|nr:hypothetical protein CANINC_001351 [[Candida] inconspicua]
MSGFNVRNVLLDLSASLTGRQPQSTTNNNENIGDTVTNAMLPGMAGAPAPVMRVVNGITSAFSAFNNVMETAAAFNGTEGTHSGRNTRVAAIKALKPLTHEEVRNINKDDPLICSICYDNLAEYKGDIEGEKIDSSHKPSNDVTAPVISPFPGYDPSDPSIMFPAIETATYVSNYILGTEPELQKQDEPSEPALDHYATQIPECGHIFGYSCIVEWFQNNTTCPLCRREVIKDDDNITPIDDDILANPASNSPMFFYDQAITESYVPIDWTCPPSSGMQILDPPLTMPVPGIGSSTGPRTGRDPE